MLRIGETRNFGNLYTAVRAAPERRKSVRVGCGVRRRAHEQESPPEHGRGGWLSHRNLPSGHAQELLPLAHYGIS